MIPIGPFIFGLVACASLVWLFFAVFLMDDEPWYSEQDIKNEKHKRAVENLKADFRRQLAALHDKYQED